LWSKLQSATVAQPHLTHAARLQESSAFAKHSAGADNVEATQALGRTIDTDSWKHLWRSKRQRNVTGRHFDFGWLFTIVRKISIRFVFIHQYSRSLWFLQGEAGATLELLERLENMLTFLLPIPAEIEHRRNPAGLRVTTARLSSSDPPTDNSTT
jgi:hypothetical protein